MEFDGGRLRGGRRTAEHEWNRLKGGLRVEDCDKDRWPLWMNGATPRKIVDGDGWVIIDIG